MNIASLSRRAAWSMAGVFLVLALVIAGAGSFFLAQLRAEFRRNVESRLAAIADLKVRQLVEWRQDLLKDAQLLMRNSFLGEHLQELFLGHTKGPLQARFLEWLDTERTHNQSGRALLLDSQLQVRLASPASHTDLGPIGQSFAAGAIRSNSVMISDLHRNRGVGYIHFDLAVPLSSANQPGAVTLDPVPARPIGALVLEIDPYQLLYPLVQVWPAPDRTGETLLVRREGDEVLYLNELRQRKNTALVLRLPLTQTNILAAQVVNGSEGVARGVDYRGEPVLGIIRKVPETNWYLLAKIDEAEAFAVFRTDTRLVVAATFGLISVAGLVLGALWRRYEARILRGELVLRSIMDAALRESEERYRLFLEDFQGIAYQVKVESNGFMILQGQVQAITGYSAEEFFNGLITWQQLIEPEDTPIVKQAIQRLIGEPGHVANHSYRIRRRDGTTRWVNDVGRLARDPATGCQVVQGAVYDITEGKHAEQQLRKLSRAVEASPASIVVTDATGKIEYVNPKFCAVTGYALEEARGQNPRILKSREMPAEFYRQLWEKILAGGEWRGEFHNKKKSGELFWEFSSISAIKDPAGRITNFVAVKEDITERKKSEAETEFLIKSLEEALANVKTLSGLIPICAGCKKIRDDTGYWNQVECYVTERSDAKFSHGLCPECAHELYPEFASD